MEFSKKGLDESKAAKEATKICESLKALEQSLGSQKPCMLLSKLPEAITCCAPLVDVMEVCEKSSQPEVSAKLPDLKATVEGIKEVINKSYPENTPAFTGLLQDLWLSSDQETLNLSCHASEEAMSCIASVAVRGTSARA